MGLRHVGGSLALGASVACYAGCSTAKSLEHDLTASCSDLSSFHASTLGCIDVPHADLGEVIAVSIDGSKPPMKLGALAVTEPASASLLATAPASCADVLTVPVVLQPGLHERHAYQLPAFKTDPSLNLGVISAQLNVDVGDKAFYLDVGELTLLTLRDPVRSLNCSSQAIAVVGRYWSGLSSADQKNAAFYVVDQVVLTDHLALSTGTGDSISATIDKYSLGVGYSVSYDCSQIAGLANEAGLTTVFIDGYPNALTFDGTSFQVSDHTVACGMVVGASP
jgi:hypothetical protein